MKDKLKKRRLHLRLTQDEMAEKLGVSRMTYARWEHGKSKPQLFHQRKIESLLNENLGQNLRFHSAEEIPRFTGLWAGSTIQPNFSPEYRKGEMLKYPMLVAFWPVPNQTELAGIAHTLWFNSVIPEQPTMNFRCSAENVDQNTFSVSYFDNTLNHGKLLGNVHFTLQNEILNGSFNGIGHNVPLPVYGQIVLKKALPLNIISELPNKEFPEFIDMITNQENFWTKQLDPKQQVDQFLTSFNEMLIQENCPL